MHVPAFSYQMQRGKVLQATLLCVLQKNLPCLFYLPSSNPLSFIHLTSPSLHAWLQCLPLHHSSSFHPSPNSTISPTSPCTLLDPGSVPGSPLTLDSLIFLLKHEASLIPVTCQLPLATLKSHPLIKCSAHSAALGAMTGGQAFLLHCLAQ